VQLTPAGIRATSRFGRPEAPRWAAPRSRRPLKCVIRKMGRKVAKLSWSSVTKMAVARSEVDRVVKGSVRMARLRTRSRGAEFGA